MQVRLEELRPRQERLATILERAGIGSLLEALVAKTREQVGLPW